MTEVDGGWKGMAFGKGDWQLEREREIYTIGWTGGLAGCLNINKKRGKERM